MKRRRCEKCGRLLIVHNTEVTSLPITCKLQEKNKQISVYYCKKCNNFRTDLKK